MATAMLRYGRGLAVGLLFVAGCLDSHFEDGGVLFWDGGPRADGPTSDSSPPPPPPLDAGDPGGGFANLPPAKVSGGSAGADYGCLGSETAPPGGAAVDFTLVLTEIVGMGSVGEPCFSFYGDNTLPASDSCAASGQRATVSPSDPSESVAPVTDPDGGWFAFRIYPDDILIGSVQQNRPAPFDGGVASGVAVTQQTADLIGGVLGVNRDRSDALFNGAVLDCQERPVEGAAFRVVRDGRMVPEGAGPSDAHYEYFNGDEFPLVGQSHTNTDGLFLGVNIPVRTQGEQVEMVACANVDGTVQMVACEHTRIFGNHMNVIALGPRRAGAPACTDICR